MGSIKKVFAIFSIVIMLFLAACSAPASESVVSVIPESNSTPDNVPLNVVEIEMAETTEPPSIVCATDESIYYWLPTIYYWLPTGDELYRGWSTVTLNQLDSATREVSVPELPYGENWSLQQIRICDIMKPSGSLCEARGLPGGFVMVGTAAFVVVGAVPAYVLRRSCSFVTNSSRESHRNAKASSSNMVALRTSAPSSSAKLGIFICLTSFRTSFAWPLRIFRGGFFASCHC